MTKKELVENLKNYPDDMQVTIAHHDGGHYDVENIKVDTDPPEFPDEYIVIE